MLRGDAVSEGVALGKALVLKEELKVPDYSIRTPDIRLELLKFDAGLAQSRDQLVELKARHAAREDMVKILDSQLLLLVDPMFVGEVIKRVRKRKRNVEKIISDVVAEFASKFQAMDNEYMRERAMDIRDVGTRILRNVLGLEPVRLESLAEDTILVCTELTASDVAHLDSERVVGLASQTGGATSHAAILAKSRGIPALVGISDLTVRVKTGDELILDCLRGLLIINPSEEERSQFLRTRDKLLSSWREVVETTAAEPAVTLDGVALRFMANISVPAEIDLLERYGAVGVGLFRTEYLFMREGGMPSEETQLEAYAKVAQAMGEGYAVIRTLDIGGDKEIPYLGIESEKNPFLGLRSIRYCLSNPDVFKTQLRAILRASAYGRVRLMYPLISSLKELHDANAVLEEVRQELRKDGVPFDESVPVGIMVEVPSVAITADQFAPHVDFFSIGSNDLVQFTLAVDRTNPRLHDRFEPFSPAVIRLVRHVLEAAKTAGIDVACCGELASRPMGLVLLAGLGLREFSMNAVSIPRLKLVARRLQAATARQLVEEALQRDNADDVRAVLGEYTSALVRNATP